MKRFFVHCVLLLGLATFAGVTAHVPSAYGCGAPLPDPGTFDCAGFTDTCEGACVSGEYAASISQSESGGVYNCPVTPRADGTSPSTALGRYQFLDGTRQGQCGGCLPCVSRAEFANCPALQDAYFSEFNRRNWRVLQNCGATDRIGQTVNGAQITESCLLAMAHLGGPGYGTPDRPGACGFVVRGWDGADAFGTTLRNYCQRHGGTQGWDTSGNCEVPPGSENTRPPAEPDPIEFNETGCGVGWCTENCVFNNHVETRNLVRRSHFDTRNFITDYMRSHQTWFISTFFEFRVLPAMMMMTEQLTAVGMKQMLILGAFFDAKHQLETQRLFARKVAEAHKKYQPSLEMCRVGTMTRSLAASEFPAHFTSLVLSRRMQERLLGMQYTNAAEGPAVDRAGRIEQFKERYCDIRDNNGSLEHMCEQNAPAMTRNNDIDYTRMIDHPRTLDIDFVDPRDSSDNEIDILALASNLYGHEVFHRMSAGDFAYEQSDDEYITLRSIMARRSVAHNSFSALVGLKAKSFERTDETTTPYYRALMEQFGIEEDDQVSLLLGVPPTVASLEDEVRPSYYAQIETLAQRVYQHPTFFTNLYDKPANVARKNVSLQAIGLMLDRDIYHSELRSEAVLSIWLEMEIGKYQAEVMNRIGELTPRQRPSRLLFGNE